MPETPETPEEAYEKAIQELIIAAKSSGLTVYQILNSVENALREDEITEQ